jgi:hypothetical protein
MKRKNGINRTYQPQKLVNAVAQATLDTKGIGLARHPQLREVSKNDRQMLQRVVGMSVEEFNSRLMSKLDNLADKILDRMLDTVDDTPLNSLGFNLSVAIDKRQRLQGINATQAANVNIQVNNYGGMSKEEIIAKLTGKPVEPKALPASEVSNMAADKHRTDAKDLADPLLIEPELVEVADPAADLAELSALRPGIHSSSTSSVPPGSP